MAYIIKNITDTSGDYIFPAPDGYVYGIDLYVADIPNVATLKWKPGQQIDLEELTSLGQIEQSRHLRVHILQGRMIKL